MKIVYGILFFFSVVATITELVKKSYFKKIQISLDVENNFVKDKFYYLNDFSSGSNNGCSTCNYVFVGYLNNAKDTTRINGQRSKMIKLFKYDPIKDKNYLDVWYCEHLKYAKNIEENADKEKPTFFDQVLIRGWVNYIFMFCSIPLGILLFKKNKNEE